jgi:putative hemolysin
VREIVRGRLRLREATDPADRCAAQAFRAQAFGLDRSRDVDAFDDAFAHVLIEDRNTGALQGCFRMKPMPATEVATGYAAQFYDLSALRADPRPILEIGRVCTVGGLPGAEVLSLAWAGIAEEVARHRIGLLVGCTSFPGIDPVPYAEAFGLLRARHLAPRALAPGIGADEVHVFVARPVHGASLAALRQMPPLLRSYLRMGAWVSDHAVIDRRLGTLHVFTGLETGAFPAARRNRLAALGSADEKAIDALPRGA